MFSHLVSAEAVLACLAVTAAAEWKIGQEVQTSSGLVKGRAATLKGAETVSEYLSIPYAAQPVGPLRWKAPQKFNGTGKVDATQWGPSCPVAGGGAGSTSAAGILGGPGSGQDEACLTLNVWTRPQKGEKKKAVLLSIYGGGFNAGSSNAPYLNGAPLAERQDVIVVSMNYRLNIFGFPGAPGLQDQNLGMLDIRAAAEWTRDNIAAFGGDPRRITMFGESAGGGATDYYAFAWPDDPIMYGFILQSGSVFTRGIAAANNDGAWYKASAALGCGGKEAGVKSTECMQSKDWRSIMKHVDTGMRQPGKTFGPVFDEKVIFKDYNARAKGGHFAKIPVIVGSNNNEAGFFKLMKNISPADMAKMNLCFTCAAAYSAKARSDHNVRAWRYRYHGDWDNIRIAKDAGAFHGAELTMVFGTPKRFESRIASSQAQLDVERLIMNSWAGFARDPSYLRKHAWPIYDPEKETLNQLAFNNSDELLLAYPKEYDADCAAYEASDDSLDTIMSRSGENPPGLLGSAFGSSSIPSGPKGKDKETK